MRHQPITWNRGALDSALLSTDPERDAIYRRMRTRKPDVPAAPSRFRRFATKPLRVLAFGFNR